MANFKANLQNQSNPRGVSETPASSGLRSKILPFPTGKDKQPPTDDESTQGDSTSGYRVGQKVQHGKFGKGIITSISRDGEMISVKFDTFGIKHLLTEMANLTAAKAVRPRIQSPLNGVTEGKGTHGP
jgi:hypothetical protein